jgi:uncharacterized membrane protein YbhN (UPF0104 family)
MSVQTDPAGLDSEEHRKGSGQPAPGSGIESKVRYGVKLALTVAVLTVLVRSVGWAEISDALLSASGTWLAVMYGLKLVRQVVDAAQLRFLLSRVKVKVGLSRVFLASQLASFYSLVVPGEIASNAAKWANLAAATGERSLLLNAMVYNKLLMLLVPSAIGALALAIDNPLQEPWLPVAAGAILLGLMLVLMGLYHPALGALSDRLFRRLGSILPERWQARIDAGLDSMAAIRSFRWNRHALMLLFALTSLSVGIGRFYTGILALGIDVPLIGVLWVIAFLGIGRLLPFTISNLGIREGLLIFALSAFAVPAERAVALGLLSFSAVVLLAIIGGVYQAVLVARR